MSTPKKHRTRNTVCDQCGRTYSDDCNWAFYDGIGVTLCGQCDCTEKARAMVQERMEAAETAFDAREK